MVFNYVFRNFDQGFLLGWEQAGLHLQHQAAQGGDGGNGGGGSEDGGFALRF